MNEYHQWQGLIRSILIDRIITFQHDVEVETNKVRINLNEFFKIEREMQIMNSNFNPFTLLFVVYWKCRVHWFYHRYVYLKKISMEETSNQFGYNYFLWAKCLFFLSYVILLSVSKTKTKKISFSYRWAACLGKQYPLSNQSACYSCLSHLDDHVYVKKDHPHCFSNKEAFDIREKEKNR